MNIDKVINPGFGEYGYVYCHIKYDDSTGQLSITGVEGPKHNGDCRGGCGQIYDNLNTSVARFSEGWDKEKLEYFVTVWKRWHLNDMRAGCEHQGSMGWDKKPIDEGLLSRPCPICGYKYGSAWLFEAVPNEIIIYLNNLPESKLKPAWV